MPGTKSTPARRTERQPLQSKVPHAHAHGNVRFGALAARNPRRCHVPSRNPRRCHAPCQCSSAHAAVHRMKMRRRKYDHCYVRRCGARASTARRMRSRTAGIILAAPSRMTVALPANMPLMASAAASALPSWTRPMETLMMMTAQIRETSAHFLRIA